MGGMKISELDFVRLLPVFMRDDEAIIAFSKAMNKLMGKPGGRLNTIRTWDQIDNLNEAECDELAWELDVDWYDSTMRLEEKQKTLKLALQIKRKRGTRWAVENLVSTCFGEGYVMEWYEYGGKPYQFKIFTNTTFTEDVYETFYNAIDVVKNVRSHIEDIVVERELYHTVFTGSESDTTPIPPVIIEKIFEKSQTADTVFVSAAARTVTRNPPIMDTFEEIEEIKETVYTDVEMVQTFIPPIASEKISEKGKQSKQLTRVQRFEQKSKTRR